MKLNKLKQIIKETVKQLQNESYTWCECHCAGGKGNSYCCVDPWYPCRKKASDDDGRISNSGETGMIRENIVYPDEHGHCECAGYTWSNCVGADGACSKGCCSYEGGPGMVSQGGITTWGMDHGISRGGRTPSRGKGNYPNMPSTR